MTILVILIDYLFQYFGVKKFGGKKNAIYGTGVGLLLGFFVPPIGFVLGAFLGSVVGFVMGSGWYALINSSGFKSMLYYSDFTGNKTICSRPQRQYFKCDVYRNGKLLQTSRFA